MKHQLVNLGDRLTSLRRNAHKSQQALADECQALGLPITRDMIANWETNRAEIPARLIPFIVCTLDAQVADLLPDLRMSAFAGLQRTSTPSGASNKVHKHRSRMPRRHTRRANPRASFPSLQKPSGMVALSDRSSWLRTKQVRSTR